MQETLRYNEWKVDWTLVDFPSIESLPKVLAYGAGKYERDNWKLGWDKATTECFIGCAMRHMVAMMNWEMVDEESGELHSGHVMANMMFINYHEKDGKQ